MKYASLLPLTAPARSPLDGAEQKQVLLEIEKVGEHGEVPALDPPEYYRVDDRLIEIWNLSPGPVVIEFIHTEVPGDREAAKARLKELVDLGLHIDSLPSWQFEETSEVATIRTGYSTSDEARADGRRLLLGSALKSDELRLAAGWDRDMVLLVLGLDWYTIRTHRDGSIDYRVNEEPLNAHMTYAEACGKLARDIDYSPDFGGHDMGPFARKVASAFVQREGANALLAQARQSLRVAMEGVDRYDKLSGTQTNIAALARNLHTDRANLYKLMPSRHTSRRR